MIRCDDLIALFQLMYAEHWAYEWGAARRGTVDCSGAFVYAFKQLGGNIYHGSNTIARKYVGAFQKEPVPGFAAFKWKKTDSDKYKDGRGDFYHIGLVDADGEHVLNAKGTKAGFCRDPVSGWYSFAPLLAVSYDDKGEAWSVTEYKAIVNVKSGRLNMRSGPGSNYSIVERLPNGTPLIVLAEFDTDGDGKANWAFVDEDGTQGYVSMAYIKIATESAQDTPQLPDIETPAEDQTQQPAQSCAERWAVWIDCENEEEARRYAGNIKGAVVIRYEKPPGESGGEEE